MSKEYTWEDVVRECEQVLQLKDHAASPLMSNLPNIIRDLVYKITVYPLASQPRACSDGAKACGYMNDDIEDCDPDCDKMDCGFYPPRSTA